jgi:hypothetical protein
MSKGWFISRREVNSIILKMPSMYSKYWLFLQNNVAFSGDNKGKLIVKSLSDVSESLTSKKEVITVSDLNRMNRFFKSRNMIKTMSRHGSYTIEICNYNDSQLIKKEGKNALETSKKQNNFRKALQKLTSGALTNVTNVTNNSSILA